MRTAIAGPVRFSVDRIPSGESGTDSTVRRLGELVEKSVQGQLIRLSALRMLERASVPNKSDAGSARAIFNWVRTHVRYVLDPLSLETIQAPELTMRIKAGDCDDHAALTTALLHSIGIPSRFVVTGPSRDRLAHIYAEALIDGNWRSMDTTRATRFGAPVPSLGVEKFYSWQGRPSMAYVSLGANTSTGRRGVRVNTQRLVPIAYRAALKALKNNWSAGLINRKDVMSYIRVIDEGNSPARGTFVEAPMRQAVKDFLSHVDRRGMVSLKGYNQSNGLEGLDGFLKSVFGAVKKAVGGAIKLVTGGGTTTVQVQPQINVPSVTTTVSPETGRAVLGDLLKSPIVWVGGGLALILLFMAMQGRR